MYTILPYSYQQAKKLGVEIYPSKNPKHKIDVYFDKSFITSIGDINYLDYPYYLKMKGKKIADERRRLYHIRHTKETKVGSKGFYAKHILW